MADLTEYAATFDLVDSDDDGMISAPEMARLMEVLGRPIGPDAAQAAVARLDANGDGLIDLEEFAAYLAANQ
ncbi:Ca2+-binding EF-hand superfamily protein [Thermocatellispora tengchongensis]|uniref:Ca2+-binding EF-hand superfamily protein n=1 Tax=Thermocatellispora tengchongensis TaxID=1073253 RepID=A0A840PNE4_9ACTN|nr:EF-hand domain-containing protein [Thermocatellispora tengchongensis]MBB5139553.1 Ca2+-binding EF-hand superfamily protein [Thermocatellispora tengchongensis]